MRRLLQLLHNLIRQIRRFALILPKIFLSTILKSLLPLPRNYLNARLMIPILLNPLRTMRILSVSLWRWRLKPRFMVAMIQLVINLLCIEMDGPLETIATSLFVVR